MDDTARQKPEDSVKPPKPVDDTDHFENRQETRKHKRIIHDYEG